MFFFKKEKFNYGTKAPTRTGDTRSKTRVLLLRAAAAAAAAAAGGGGAHRELLKQGLGIEIKVYLFGNLVRKRVFSANLKVVSVGGGGSVSNRSRLQLLLLLGTAPNKKGISRVQWNFRATKSSQKIYLPKKYLEKEFTQFANGDINVI